VAEELPRLKELGFDVVYLPPIHPIGHKNRKGRNNALVAGPDDPGSPWAIGAAEGGHEAVHPELGTHDDVRALTAAAAELGIDVALDFAIQCSADHPWLTEHPDWFHHRPDGTLKYAENPPKKYQDIYNVNWDCEDWQGLWQAVLDLALLWVDHGVKVFRVDNPHTKPTAFWEWMIREVQQRHPEVVFLSEAFTRRARLVGLAKAGFTQSYTYFTWKNTRWELEQFIGELLTPVQREVVRPEPLRQHAGHPARVPPARRPAGVRRAARPGGDAEPDVRHLLGLRALRARAGQARLGGVPGLREVRGQAPQPQRAAAAVRADGQPGAPREPRAAALREHHLPRHAQRRADRLRQAGAGQHVICVVNLDPFSAQEGEVHVPDHLGLPLAFMVHDLLDDSRFGWHLGGNYVRLEPPFRQAHVLRVEGPR
jgi:starch synthase (maltosyl-transferring)